jgi:hypothetical protein
MFRFATSTLVLGQLTLKRHDRALSGAIFFVVARFGGLLSICCLVFVAADIITTRMQMFTCAAYG